MIHRCLMFKREGVNYFSFVPNSSGEPEDVECRLSDQAWLEATIARISYNPGLGDDLLVLTANWERSMAPTRAQRFKVKRPTVEFVIEV